jgi:hypothetical protein
VVIPEKSFFWAWPGLPSFCCSLRAALFRQVYLPWIESPATIALFAQTYLPEFREELFPLMNHLPERARPACRHRPWKFL